MISYSACFTTSAASFSGFSPVRSPCRRMRGGSPAIRCRSEPRFSSTSISSASTYATALSARRAGHRGGRGAGAVEFRQHAGVGDVLLEGAFLAGVVVGVVRVDGSRADGGQQRLIEQLHPHILAHLHLRGDLVRLF